jgi:starch synthase
MDISSRLIDNVDPSAAVVAPGRAQPRRILMAASEIYPLAKTGGLADVLGALPSALRDLGADLRLLLPAYPSALDAVRDANVVANLGEVCGVQGVRILAGRTPDTGLPVWLVDCPALYRRPGSPYQDASGEDWPDNWLRFGVFCHVVAWCARASHVLDWRPDVVHCHDWQTGLIPLLLRRGDGAHRAHTLFTLHNAAFHGSFEIDTARRLGIAQDLLHPDGVEFYGKLSFLKAGVRYADKLSTVSPRYAREICTPEFGCGLDGLYAARAGDLTGILNGIDTALWNPATDSSLAACFSASNSAGKRLCKAALQREFRLAEAPAPPLLAFVARLTTQKMADVVLDRLPAMFTRHPDLQCVVLGRGERLFEDGFARLQPHFPGRLGVRIGYSEALAHRIQAGADILLHGARFEPCGLTQMHAMRYGTVPIVRGVGGLAETVIDADMDIPGPLASTGFVFAEASGEAMDAALDRCLRTYREAPTAWHTLQTRAMLGDFGWARSARAYIDLYQTLEVGRATSQHCAG